jgi:ATP-dependent DNA ligase
LAAIERAGWRLWGRGEDDYTARYPELEILRQLPWGTVLDGEVVRLAQDGRADFSGVQRRHQLASRRKIRWASAREPVTYVVFDLLQLHGRCLMRQPLTRRRDLLEELLSQIPCEPLRLSGAVTGAGTSFFQQAAAQGHEGVMAKRLDSHYHPGKRSSAWRKIKPRDETVCVVIGYRARRDGSLTGLLLATTHGSELSYVGEVCGGLSSKVVGQLASRLAEQHCREPLVPCPRKAQWVHPELYCRVRHFGRSGAGRLRFPCLVRLLEAGPAVTR